MNNIKNFKLFESEINKNSISNIKNIDDFIDIINNMDKIPQRGFSYKPNSAVKLEKNTLLFHSTTEQNIKSIIESGFKGVGAYYSSFTKTRKSKEQIKDGNFAFAFDLTNKNVDSRYQKDFLYGGYGLIFKSNSAMKVYNTNDKQNQVIFDVSEVVDILFVVHPKVDMKNTKEFIWDIYDKNFKLIESDIKLKDFIKKQKSPK